MDEKILVEGQHYKFIDTFNKHGMKIIIVLSILVAFMYLFLRSMMVFNLLMIDILLIIAYLIVHFGIVKSTLTITDKRVYGTAFGGQRVDLPIDSITACAHKKFFKAIAFSTSSGRIMFPYISNLNECYDTISRLLVNRQDRSNLVQQPVQIIKKDDATDKLIKYKDLLDKGIITQEEFDAKKKELLDL